MKKGLIAAAVALFALSGCTKGVEKEYTMEIKSEVMVARLEENETETVNVVHCKRGMSLFNYYIVLPE